MNLTRFKMRINFLCCIVLPLSFDPSCSFTTIPGFKTTVSQLHSKASYSGKYKHPKVSLHRLHSSKDEDFKISGSGSLDDDFDDDFDSAELLSELQSLIVQTSDDSKVQLDEGKVMEGLEALVGGAEANNDQEEEDLFAKMLESLPDDGLDIGLGGQDQPFPEDPKPNQKDSWQTVDDSGFDDNFLAEISKGLSSSPSDIQDKEDDSFLKALSNLIAEDLNDPIAPVTLRNQNQQPPRRRQRESLPDFDLPRRPKRSPDRPVDPVFKYSKRIVDCKESGNWEEAISILKETIDNDLTPSTRMFTEVMTQCSRNRQQQKAIEVYQMARECNVPADTYFYSAVISAASYVLNAEETWQISKQMHEEQGVQFDEHCYTALIIAMGRMKNKDLIVAAVKELEEDILVYMNLRLYSSIVTAFLQVGDKETGMKYFKQLKEEGLPLDERIYSSSIKALSSNGDFDEAFGMYQDMIQSGISPSFRCYRNIFRTCDLSGDWQTALEILKDIQNSGGDASSHVEQVVGILVRAGQEQKASELLASTDKTQGVAANTRMYSALMVEHSKNKDYDATVKVKRDLVKAGLRLDKAGYNALISVCKATNRQREALKYFDEMKKARVDPDGFTYNNIISIHSQNKDGEKALQLLDQMEEEGFSDTVTYNLVIRACAKQRNADPEQPLKLYRRMRRRSIEPNLFVYNSLMSSSAQLGDWQMAQYFLGEMRLKDIQPDIFSYSAGVTASSNAQEPESAMQLFKEMEENRIEPDEIILYQMVRCFALAGDLSTSQAFLEQLESMPKATQYSVSMGYRYTAIASLISGDPDQAAELWQEAAEIRYTEPEDYSFAFKACAQHGFWEFASDLLAEARADGIDCGKLFYEQVISACAKGGAPEMALDWLEEMIAEPHSPHPSVITEISQGCVEAEDWETVLKLLDKMKNYDDVELEDQCYSHAVITCSKARVFEPAVSILKFIESNNIKLSLEAYNSLLQLLLPTQPVSL